MFVPTLGYMRSASLRGIYPIAGFAGDGRLRVSVYRVLVSPPPPLLRHQGCPPGGVALGFAPGPSSCQPCEKKILNSTVPRASQGRRSPFLRSFPPGLQTRLTLLLDHPLGSIERRIRRWGPEIGPFLSIQNEMSKFGFYFVFWTPRDIPSSDPRTLPGGASSVPP